MVSAWVPTVHCEIRSANGRHGIDGKLASGRVHVHVRLALRRRRKFTTSIQPAKAYEDESVMMSGPH